MNGMKRTAGLWLLIEHPEVERALRRDRSHLRNFVEEVLRLQPPVHGLFRTAMKDTVLGGTPIPAMAQLCVLYASANDDDAKFPDPRRLDIERPNVGASLTFGSGIHKCVGLSLARMEIKALFNELLPRLKSIELAGEPRNTRANFVSGLKTLPVRYELS